MLQETKVSRQSNETFKNSYDIITFHPNFVLKGTTKDGCIWLLDFQSKSMVNNLAGSRLYDIATSYKANTVANWYNRLTINRLLGWFNTEWVFNVCVYIHDLVRSSIPCGPSGVGAGGQYRRTGSGCWDVGQASAELSPASGWKHAFLSRNTWFSRALHEPPAFFSLLSSHCST